MLKLKDLIEEDLSQGIARDYFKAREHAAKAESALKDNNPEIARMHYGAALRFYQDNGRLQERYHFARGVELFRKDEFGHALEEFENSLQLITLGRASETLLNWLRMSAIMSENYSKVRKMGIHIVDAPIKPTEAFKRRFEQEIFAEGWWEWPEPGSSSNCFIPNRTIDPVTKMEKFFAGYCNDQEHIASFCLYSYGIRYPSKDCESGGPESEIVYKRLLPFYQVCFLTDLKDENGDALFLRPYHRKPFDNGGMINCKTFSKRGIDTSLTHEFPSIRIQKPDFVNGPPHEGGRGRLDDYFVYDGERPVLIPNFEVECEIVERLRERGHFWWKELVGFWRTLLDDPLQRELNYIVNSEFLRKANATCFYDGSFFYGSVSGRLKILKYDVSKI